MFDFFNDFSLGRVDVGEAELRVRYGGTGPPLVLLHGHPRTHTTWWQVAPQLASRFTVICPDLRGYGESTKPASSPDHETYSKRAMATDVLRLAATLGHAQFGVAGHDRGAYVAQRLALDHPDVVTRLAVLDAVPIGEALARVDAAFATAWWHWFFLAQSDKPAERVINADPDAWYHGSADRMGAANFADYRRAIHNPETVHAMCEDYRAGLGVDRAADEADLAAGRRIGCPTMMLWSTEDDMVSLYGDPLAVWRRWVAQPVELTGHPISSGHHMAEENPDELVRALDSFFGAGS
ncbi:MAG: alpha/beta hydrolase [Frankiales bacterium]|nr:alpha/beta hydrolase [Frankiales bacterium]